MANEIIFGEGFKQQVWGKTPHKRAVNYYQMHESNCLQNVKKDLHCIQVAACQLLNETYDMIPVLPAKSFTVFCTLPRGFNPVLTIGSGFAGGMQVAAHPLWGDVKEEDDGRKLNEAYPLGFCFMTSADPFMQTYKPALGYSEPLADNYLDDYMFMAYVEAVRGRRIKTAPPKKYEQLLNEAYSVMTPVLGIWNNNSSNTTISGDAFLYILYTCDSNA